MCREMGQTMYEKITSKKRGQFTKSNVRKQHLLLFISDVMFTPWYNDIFMIIIYIIICTDMNLYLLWIWWPLSDIPFRSLFYRVKVKVLVEAHTHSQTKWAIYYMWADTFFYAKFFIASLNFLTKLFFLRSIIQISNIQSLCALWNVYIEDCSQSVV